MNEQRFLQMEDIRWKQRFENFERAFNKPKKAVHAYKQTCGDELIQMALIQAFEFTFELGWKTLKDYLEESGIIIEEATPKYVIKKAYEAKLIKDGEAWIDIINDRNLTSHTYNEEKAKKVIDNVINFYMPEFEQVYSYFKKRL